MEKVIVYCGEGKGKTAAALGWGMLAANQGKSVIIIRFMKGRQEAAPELLSRLEPELKVFSFEKHAGNYNELTPEEQREESANIKNGLGFAKKVLVTGECDLLILDEVLGLLDQGLLTTEELKDLLRTRTEDTGLVITGIHMREELFSCVDEVFDIEPSMP